MHPLVHRNRWYFPCFMLSQATTLYPSLPKWEEKTVWKVWATHDEFTSIFCELHNSPQQISEEAEAALEYFTILLYDRTATCTSINEVGKLLFTPKGRQMSALTPTKAAYSNILDGQSCKVVIAGLVLRCHIIKCHLLLTGEEECPVQIC